MPKQTIREQIAEFEVALKAAKALAKKLDRRLETRQDKADDTENFDAFHEQWEKCGYVVEDLEAATENLRDLKRVTRSAKD